MKRRKITTNQDRKSKIRREREPVSWKYILLISFCGLMLVVGFFGAARQHFASINYSIKNSKLKKEVEELKSDKRRLQLAKEVALSPAEIKKSAKKMGFTEMTASNIKSFRVENVSDEKSNVNKPSEPKVAKTSSIKNETDKNKVIKEKNEENKKETVKTKK